LAILFHYFEMIDGTQRLIRLVVDGVTLLSSNPGGYIKVSILIHFLANWIIILLESSYKLTWVIGSIFWI
jgi:hypothetical protein